MSKGMKRKTVHERIARVCVFDEKKDFMQVPQGLAVSLSESLKTGVVKDSLASLESNGIQDPEAIVGRVNDRFDAIEADRAIRKYGKKAKLPETVVSAPVEKSADGKAGE